MFAFTPPLPFYTSRLYPEAVAVLPTAVFLLTTRGRVGWPEAGAAALAAASLPWLHSKMLPVAFLGLALTLVRPGKWGPRLLALAVFALSVGGLLVYFQAHYGQATLSAAFGPPDLALPRAPRQTLALFFDRQYGLFSTGPIWALALPGAVVLLRQRTGHALRAFLLAAPPVGIAAIFAMWWGGSSPPARFLLPALPALALCLAPALRMRPVLAVALAALGLGVVGFAADAPRILHNRADGDSLLLRFLSPAVDVSAVSPSFIALEPGAVPLALGLAAAFFLVWAWGLRGTAVGLVSLGFLAHAFAHRPLIDPLAATQAVLDAWTPDHFEGPGGPPRVRSLVLPLELPREPWRLTSGETRNSRRLSLPPGDYRLELRASSSGPFSARVHFHSGELILATAEVGTKTPEITVPLLLPAGAPGFGLTATGAFGATSLDGVRVRPEALAPRGARAQIPWLEFARGDRYRVPAGRLRVTVLDRSEPLIHGFLTAPGGGRFLVDGAPGEEVVLRVLPAGATTSREIRMRLGDGVSLGGAAVLPVQVPDEGALVTFSSSAP